jgi:hypothetical protein
MERKECVHFHLIFLQSVLFKNNSTLLPFHQLLVAERLASDSKKLQLFLQDLVRRGIRVNDDGVPAVCRTLTLTLTLTPTLTLTMTDPNPNPIHHPHPNHHPSPDPDSDPNPHSSPHPYPHLHCNDNLNPYPSFWYG